MPKKTIKKLIGDFGYELSKKAQPKPAELPTCFTKQVQLIGNNIDPIIFDIGAHKGETSTIYRSLFPQATIHAFEPFLPMYEEIKTKFETDKKFVVNNLALTRKPGRYQLHLNEYSATNSLLPVDERAQNYWGTGINTKNEQEAIAGISLDDYCALQKIKHIDILKIDVQGYEFEVLKGAVDLLENKKVDIIFTEFIIAATYVNQSFFEEVIQFLRQHNYQLFNFFNFVESYDQQLMQVDAIFTTSKSKQ